MDRAHRMDETLATLLRRLRRHVRFNSLRQTEFHGRSSLGEEHESSRRAEGLCGPCPLPAVPARFRRRGAHWSYEGATGPAKWGDLDAADKVCAIGLQQSPIDIVAPIKSQLPPIKLNW